MMVILSDSRMFFSSLMPGINAQLQKEYSLGIVLAAEVEEAGSENSVLLAHFPCLGFSQASEPNAASQNNLPEPEDNTESWSLSRYLTLKELAIDPNDIVEQRLCVHRAMFACFNEDFIMIAQSKGARNLTRNIFPEQDRAGAFHLLVNMIAETLRYDDRKILKVLGANAAVYVRS
ncbi:hypothetical protein K440DRAFT_19475 [Wilcoxina mikolae CBS 423.85]|nr:hypothetical protein K440DRAFT_19475 [Wilcoxina mikolae CBS 423.85]